MPTIAALALIMIVASFVTLGVALRAPAPFVDVSLLVKSDVVDPVQLEKHVVTISEQLGPRDFSNLEGLKEVANYIFTEFDLAGGGPEYQDYLVGSTTYQNIIARFGPQTEERIVIGAHYDSAGALPGADDNASGVAGVIELAKLFRDYPPNIGVELVAYCLEEPPYFRTPSMGSAVHAKSLRDEGVKVRAMYSLEMLGFYSDEPNSQRYPSRLLNFFYPSVGNFMTVVGTFGQENLVGRVAKAMQSGTSLPIYAIRAPKFLVGIDFSDHMNYWNNDYPAVMITDTSFYRNANYHTEYDTADTLDYERMAQTITAVWNSVTYLSNG
ncbi:MAG: M28 family peptidase [Myxococcota bacterium]|nr:M28 family peptidase [Myxococcota bacterium]